MWELLGLLTLVVGIALRLHTLAVVLAATLVIGLGSGLSWAALVELLGKLFVDGRFMTLPVILMLPVIGLLERHGLEERAAVLLRRTGAATAGRILWVYQAARGISSMFGLSLGGHASMVRPVLAPMAEGAAHAREGAISPARSREIRAHAAASENVGNFFSDDVFVQVGPVLLIQGVLASAMVDVSARRIALWGLPVALWVLLVGAWRYRRLSQRPTRAEPGDADRDQERSP